MNAWMYTSDQAGLQSIVLSSLRPSYWPSHPSQSSAPHRAFLKFPSYNKPLSLLWSSSRHTHKQRIFSINRRQ